MSAYIKPYRKLINSNGVTRSLYKTDASHYYVDATTPKAPDIPAQVAPPTIDEAQQGRQEYDRLRRRKGVLSNIYAGNSSAPASVGKATLG